VGYRYDKDELKNNLDIESVASLISHFGGEPMMKGDQFVAKTICHNDFGEGSHKLYYYDNTKLFKCYTNCEIQDIFEIIIKAKKMQEGVEWQLPQAMHFVASFFGISATEVDSGERTEDWKILNNYDRIANIDLEKKEVQLKTYDRDILKFFPQPHIIPWEKEGITYFEMKIREISYNPSTGGIIIPHFDINGNLIGIRERTLLTENEKWGKYLPSIIQGVQYSHPLSFNLYGLDKSKDNIKDMKTAIIVEGEKSVLLYESFFGIENSIICATCGSNLINFQFQLLISLGVQEVIVGFDKDFKDKQDENFIKVVNKLKNIDKKYGSYVKLSFLFDKDNNLGYKNSPLDKGPDVFQFLYKNRITL
jgi:hypothetical protein